jgi:hypothetical protein
MMRLRVLFLSMAALSLTTGCATAVTATQNSSATASGELWYVKQSNLFGLVTSSSIWHCAPPTKGRATCVEAQIVDGGKALEEAGARATEEPGANAASPPAPRGDPPIWRVASRSIDLAAACREVDATLDEDEECAGEQCRAPLELMHLFITRCREQPATDFAAAVKRRDLWRERVDGDGGACFATLKKAIRDADAADEYTSQCLKGREPGKLEKAILDGKGQQRKKKAKEPAPAE